MPIKIAGSSCRRRSPPMRAAPARHMSANPAARPARRPARRPTAGAPRARRAPTRQGRPHCAPPSILSAAEPPHLSTRPRTRGSTRSLRPVPQFRRGGLKQAPSAPHQAPDPEMAIATAPDPATLHLALAPLPVQVPGVAKPGVAKPGVAVAPNCLADRRFAALAMAPENAALAEVQETNRLSDTVPTQLAALQTAHRAAGPDLAPGDLPAPGHTAAASSDADSHPNPGVAPAAPATAAIQGARLAVHRTVAERAWTMQGLLAEVSPDAGPDTGPDTGPDAPFAPQPASLTDTGCAAATPLDDLHGKAGRSAAPLAARCCARSNALWPENQRRAFRQRRKARDRRISSAFVCKARRTGENRRPPSCHLRA